MPIPLTDKINIVGHGGEFSAWNINIRGDHVSIPGMFADRHTAQHVARLFARGEAPSALVADENGHIVDWGTAAQIKAQWPTLGGEDFEIGRWHACDFGVKVVILG